MGTPTTRAALATYALRKLGEPVIHIEVDDDQVEDRIDDALQFFSEYHFDGVESVALKHTITAAEFASAATLGYVEFSIPTNVVSVKHVFPFSDSFTDNFFDAKYQMVLSDIQEWGTMDLIGYDMTRRHYSLVEFMLSPAPQFQFHRVKDTLKIYSQGDSVFSAGSIILFEAWVTLDPETYGEIYNDILLKKYVTALIKRQWGANISKFEGMQLPGGVAFNGQGKFDEAQAEVEKIEEEVQLKWEDPPMGFIG